MIKFISAVIFFSLIFNISIAQTGSIKKDISSYIFFSELGEKLTEKKFENKDYSSFYFYKSSTKINSSQELWSGTEIYIDKFGGYYVENKSVSENEVVEKETITEKNFKFPQWLFIFYIVLLIILAWTNFFYSKYLVELFKACFNYRSAEKLFSESSILTGRSAFAILSFFVLSISLSLFLIAYYFNFELIINFIFLILIILFSVIILFIKSLIILFAGKLINKQKAASLYNYNIRLYNQILGLLLFPMLVILNYIDSEYKFFTICCMFFTFIFVYILRLIRSAKIFFHEHFSILYLFLYLCIIEFLPIYILIRLLNNTLI